MSEQSIRESLAGESIFNLIHNESVIKVDCIVRKSSEFRKIEFERRQKISILDFRKNLLATGYDSDYLRHWTHELKLDSLLEECLRD